MRSIKQAGCCLEKALRHELTALPHQKLIVDDLALEYAAYRLVPFCLPEPLIIPNEKGMLLALVKSPYLSRFSRVLFSREQVTYCISVVFVVVVGGGGSKCGEMCSISAEVWTLETSQMRHSRQKCMLAQTLRR